MDSESRIYFRNVKAVSVVSYDNVGRIKDFIEFGDQRSIVMGAVFVEIEVREDKTFDFSVTFPPDCKTKQVSIPLDPNGISFVGLPSGDD